MLDTALKILKTIEENGYKAYIVGGFVRDYVLGIQSNDIDICTSATPKDISQIFSNAYLSNNEYGSVTIIYGNIRFEITTFRKESNYSDNRRPDTFEFIDDIYEDLKRRDFLINTLCMDKDGNILDLLDGKNDINNKIIHTVGNSYVRFSEDAFRILRAVRFATFLNFELSDDIKKSILDTKHLLKRISYERKREELDKIFTSGNISYGIDLLCELELDRELELGNLNRITNYDDLMGIWAQISYPNNTYKFTSNEKDLINRIKEVLILDNTDSNVLYEYGLYVNSVAAAIKGIDKKVIADLYNKLPIKSNRDIKINGEDISLCLNREPGKYIKEIINDIKNKILNNSLENDKEVLIKYVEDNYSVI